MKMNQKGLFLLILSSILALSAGKIPEKEYYQIRIYHLKNDAQVQRVEDFLKDAFLPAMHTAGITRVGVFKPIEQDTVSKKIYLLIPYQTLADVKKTEEALSSNKEFQKKGTDYLNASHENSPYERMEVILLEAFSHQPKLQLPDLKSPPEQRVYELRSYEGHTEKIFKNKVKMFNEGGEIALFDRLGFNAVFYGEVISGAKMPNLMYLTTFENKSSRDEHWKNFGADPEWKKLSGMPEYQNNVSKIDIYFLRPTAYSDI